MRLFDSEEWPRHRRWSVFCGVVLAAAIGWYAVACFQASRLLGGSSLPGLVTGVLASAIIVFECLLALKRFPVVKWVSSRVTAKGWLRAHIWFGLLCIPLAIIHAGVVPRGFSLPTVLLIVFSLVSLSGIFGLVLQQFLPRELLHEVSGETIFSQIPALADQMSREAEVLVLATCGVADDHATEPPAELTANIAVITAARKGRGTGLLAQLPATPVEGADELRTSFHDKIAPFLRGRASRRSPLRSRGTATSFFEVLKRKLNPAAHPTVDALEKLCERRRQLDHQVWIHFWLHSWLWVHLPLSAALLVLLGWHVLTAWNYW